MIERGDKGAGAWLGLAARMAIGLVFVVSGTFKAAAPAEEFALVIDYYRLIGSQDLILVLSTFLPWIEVVVGFALIFGFVTRAAAIAAGGMFLAFIIAVISTKARGIELPNCGCFGFGWHPSATQTLIMDSLLSLASIQVFRQGERIWSLDNWCSSGYN